MMLLSSYQGKLVALLGIDRRAPVNEPIDFSFPGVGLNQAQLVFAVEVRDGARTLLGPLVVQERSVVSVGI